MVFDINVPEVWLPMIQLWIEKTLVLLYVHDLGYLAQTLTSVRVM